MWDKGWVTMICLPCPDSERLNLDSALESLDVVSKFVNKVCDLWHAGQLTVNTGNREADYETSIELFELCSSVRSALSKLITYLHCLEEHMCGRGHEAGSV